MTAPRDLSTELPPRPSRQDATSRPRSALATGLLWLVAAGLLLPLTGCGGCRIRKPVPQAERKKPEAPKPDFESKDLRVLPVDESLALQAIKPGHWFSVQQELKSNRADFFGELDCRSGYPSGEAMRLRQSYFGLQARRAVSLPKGQSKTFELTYFAPDPAGQQRIWLHSDLRLPLGGLVRTAAIQPQPTLPLRAYQNHLVVLARRPDSYGYLKTLPSIKPPTDAMYVGGIVSDYVVILARPTGVAPLPSRPLQWTTISYVVWDDFDAAGLTSDQQQALLDWLHWGGQLLISGPGSLDAMQSGFLAALLPARPGPMRALEPSEVELLNAQWCTRGTPRLQLNPQLPPQVVSLALQEGAEFSQGSGQLVAERRVGRGRIAITAFSLRRGNLSIGIPAWTISSTAACCGVRPDASVIRTRPGCPPNGNVAWRVCPQCPRPKKNAPMPSWHRGGSRPRHC